MSFDEREMVWEIVFITNASEREVPSLLTPPKMRMSCFSVSMAPHHVRGQSWLEVAMTYQAGEFFDSKNSISFVGYSPIKVSFRPQKT